MMHVPVCVLVRVCVCLCVCVCVSTLAILISGRLQFVPCVPCWAGMDFGGPKAGKDTDVGKLGKLAQRVEKILQEQVVFREPKQLDPSSILVAPLNRDGAPPNVPHIHQGILAGFFEKGFDSTRPQVGICVEFKSPEGKRKLLQITTGSREAHCCSRGLKRTRSSTVPWQAHTSTWPSGSSSKEPQVQLET